MLPGLWCLWALSSLIWAPLPAFASLSPSLAPLRLQNLPVDRLSNGYKQRSYVVVLGEEAPLPLTENRSALEVYLSEEAKFDQESLALGQLSYIYHLVNSDPKKSSLRGFAIWAGPEELENLRHLSHHVAFIEEDAWDHEDAVPSKPDWGQVRVDERTATDNKKSYEKIELPNRGEDAAFWILDGGIYKQHQDFLFSNGTSRVEIGPNWGNDDPPAGSYNDCRGHGTHVASSAAGRYRGIATASHITSLRITNCQGAGTKSASCAAMDYASSNRLSGKANIVTMSVGGLYSEFQNSCVDAIVDSGMLFVCSAGNSNSNACQRSPASAEKSIAVGSTDANDNMGSYSCWGPCVTVMAPGMNIEAADITAADGYSKRSGTSMACPLVAGSIAIYASMSNNPASVTLDGVKAALNSFGTKGAVKNLRGDTNNLMVYDRWDSSGYGDGGNGAGSDQGSSGGGNGSSRGGKDKEAVAVQLTKEDLLNWAGEGRHHQLGKAPLEK